MPNLTHEDMTSLSIRPGTAPTNGQLPPPTETQAHKETRIGIKNRRKRYLDLHPEYFKSPDLELADPLLYDRLIRHFQTPQEREKEGRERGYTGVLEADLARSEAKIAALKNQSQNPNSATSSAVIYKRAPDGHILAIEQDEEASDKDSAWERWTDLMTQRFLRGEDGDFEYEGVDGNEEFDDWGEEERRRLERYLGDQTPEFVGDGTPKGETGVQDF